MPSARQCRGFTRKHAGTVENLKGKRDRALLAVLPASGLRRHEAVNLDFRQIQLQKVGA